MAEWVYEWGKIKKLQIDRGLISLLKCIEVQCDSYEIFQGRRLRPIPFIMGKYIGDAFSRGYNIARNSYSSAKCPGCDKNGGGIFVDYLLNVTLNSSLESLT